MIVSLRMTALLILLIPALAAAQGGEPDNARLTVTISHADGGKTSERHRLKLFEALHEEGCKVMSSSAPATAPAQLLFAPAPVSLVSQQMPGYRLIGKARALDGSQKVRGAILVHAATGITDLELLQGKWISFVSKSSWPGYRLPIKLLQEAGVNETNSPFYFVGNHVGAVSALLHKDVHVAVMAEPLAQRWAEQNGLSIVAVTEAVETGGWWMHRSVSDEVVKRCTQAITRLERPRHKALPAWIDGFVRIGGSVK
jgi:hypothetical protein